MIDLLFRDPASYVQNGGSTGLANVAPDHPVWVRFAKSMVPLAAPTAKLVAAHVVTFSDPPYTVLDIAAGHGLFGIEVAKALPDALITAVDWAPVSRTSCAASAPTKNPGTLAGALFFERWCGQSGSACRSLPFPAPAEQTNYAEAGSEQRQCGRNRCRANHILGGNEAVVNE